MENTDHGFNFEDALLLFAIGYCQRHGENATLGRVFLAIDAINRSSPMRDELEDGLNQLLVGGYIEVYKDKFVATELGVRLFDEASDRKTHADVFEELHDLAGRLGWRVSTGNSPERIVITDAQVTAATQEMHAIYEEIVARINDRDAK